MTAKHILLFTLIFSLLLIAPCAAETSPAPSDHAADSDQFTLPASGVISVSEEIDGTAPDKKTAEAFLWSSTADLIFDAVSHKENQEPLILKDFPYHTAGGQVIIRNITAAELFDSMNTTFTAYGWLTSVDTHEYVEISVEEPVQRSDLINLWNFVQETAKQHGFEKTIPLRFVAIQFTGSQQDPTCIYWYENGTTTCTYDPTPSRTKSPVPIIGILGGLGLVAVFFIRKHR